MKCGLLGRTLGHSYSPQIHSHLGDYSYELFEREPEDLENFLKYGAFSGINVTAPYKKAVIPFLDALSPAAEKLGAVNTVVRRSDGTLWGHNTDYSGFYYMVLHSGISVTGKKVLVLGSGGASNTAVAVLLELGAEVTVISRTGENNYSNLRKHTDAAVIVNTTPVGMYPDTGTAPVDLKQFPALEGVLDVIYNPARTQLLLDAQSLGIPHANGLGMLVAQAKEASECFSGRKLGDSLIDTVHSRLASRMQNIVLIGMPGCGKSTVGALVAEKLGRKLADADEEVIRLAGKTIPDIFREDGESVFRDWETAALARLGKQSGLVIATGGGCVTQMRNYPLLHQNGRVFWLQRSIAALPAQGRPLSQRNSLSALYSARRSHYETFADCVIDNNAAPEDAAAAIAAYWEEEL